MEKITFQNILNQRKLSTHILFLLFSVFTIMITILLKSDFASWRNYFGGLILIFIQIELFIFLASKIFRELNPGIARKEFTRIILSRFVFFYFTCFITAFIVFILFIFARQVIYGKETTGLLSNFFQFQFSGWLKSTVSGLSIGAVIFLIVLWQDALKGAQKLREENLIFQNETLKNQVNPHFLFNSLNTISSLMQTQPETAEKFINNLSSVYRYILENGQKNKVPLQAELDFIKEYFDLHKIRDEEKIVLDINTFEIEKFQVLPVSLQILLENAIKHNIATRDNQLRISIYIENQFIVVKNNLQRMATQLNTTKTGLKNLAERVRLISGKDLIIDEIDNYFIVKLPLLR